MHIENEKNEKSNIYIYVKHLKMNKFSEFIQLIT